MAGVGLPPRLVPLGQAQAGVAGEDVGEGDLGLEPGERGAEAVVDAVAERDVPGSVRTADVEPVGVGEDTGIAVGAEQGYGRGAKTVVRRLLG